MCEKCVGMDIFDISVKFITFKMLVKITVKIVIAFPVKEVINVLSSVVQLLPRKLLIQQKKRSQSSISTPKSLLWLWFSSANPILKNISYKRVKQTEREAKQKPHGENRGRSEPKRTRSSRSANRPNPRAFSSQAELNFHRGLRSFSTQESRGAVLL